MGKAPLSLDNSSEQAIWRTAIQAYRRDQVDVALDVATADSGQALSLYRQIEGEGLTRQRGRIEEIAPGVRFEWVPSELHHHEEVVRAVLHAIDDVNGKLQRPPQRPLLVTVLVAEADADWHDARYGYFIDKEPCNKICLPLACCSSLDQCVATTSHEFTHVVIHDATLDRAPEWFQEGFACLVESRRADLAAKKLHNADHWLAPHDLNAAFHADRRVSDSYSGVLAAYDQSLVIAKFVFENGGFEKIGKLLDAFADNSALTELTLRVLNRDEADEAVHEVFGFGQKHLFDQAQAWAWGSP